MFSLEFFNYQRVHKQCTVFKNTCNYHDSLIFASKKKGGIYSNLNSFNSNSAFPLEAHPWKTTPEKRKKDSTCIFDMRVESSRIPLEMLMSFEISIRTPQAKFSSSEVLNLHKTLSLDG